MLLVGLKEQYESKIKDKNMNRESMIHKRDVVKKIWKSSMAYAIKHQTPPLNGTRFHPFHPILHIYLRYHLLGMIRSKIDL